MHAERTALGLTIDVASEAETNRIGVALAAVIGPGVVIGLVGPLGAGKTCLVRALAEALGVNTWAISSPTFVLIHEYEGRIPVYHFDTYRLGGPEEFEALGVADYWGGEGLCLVEWADRVIEQLPSESWFVRIEPTGINRRRFHLEFPRFSEIADRILELLDRV